MVLFWQNLAADAEWHPDGDANVKIETGSRIPTRQPFVFRNRCSNISAIDWDIWLKFGVQIDVFLLTEVNWKPEVDCRRRGRHLEKVVWPHSLAVGGPVWMKFIRLVQDHSSLMVIRPKLKLEVELQYGGRFFWKPEVLMYLSCGLRSTDWTGELLLYLRGWWFRMFLRWEWYRINEPLTLCSLLGVAVTVRWISRHRRHATLENCTKEVPPVLTSISGLVSVMGLVRCLIVKHRH